MSGEEKTDSVIGDKLSEKEPQKEKTDLERLSDRDLDEVLWRRLSFFAYFAVLLAIGVPVWYFTTTPYRAHLPRFAEDSAVNVPLFVDIYYTPELKGGIDRLAGDLKEALNDHLGGAAAGNLAVVFKGVRHQAVASAADAVNRMRASKDGHGLRILLTSEKDRGTVPLDKSGDIEQQLRRYGAILVQWDRSVDVHHIVQNLKETVLQQYLALDRLRATVNRLNTVATDRMSLQIAKPSVWDELPIVPKYDAHVIFIHVGTVRDRNAEAKICDSVNRLANYVANTTHVGLSWEHFWSFDLDRFTAASMEPSLIGDASRPDTPRVISANSVTPLITEIDKYSSPIGGYDPLIKIAVIFADSGITAVDDQGHPVNALAVASWGGVVPWQSTAPENAISGVLRTIQTQMGIGRNSATGSTGVVLDRLNLNSYSVLAFVEHMAQTVHYINALYSLTDEIGDLVVSDEVSAMAEEAFALFHQANSDVQANGILNVTVAAKARILAERAAKHPTLLQFLNFPADQKYAVYLPMFLPILIPMMEPILPVIRSLLKRKKTA